MKAISVNKYEVRKGDYAVTPSGRKKVIETVSPGWVTLDSDPNGSAPVDFLSALGITFERDMPDTPRIPDEGGAVIRLEDGVIFERYVGGKWWTPREDYYYTHSTVQALADDHGFTVLWPVPEPPALAKGQVWRHADGSSYTVGKEMDLLVTRGLHCSTYRDEDGTHSQLVTADGLIEAGYTLDTEAGQWD